MLRDLGAEWIIQCDEDEFLRLADRDLRSVLRYATDRSHTVINVPCFNLTARSTIRSPDGPKPGSDGVLNGFLDESRIEAIMRAVERRRHPGEFGAPSASGGEFRHFLLCPPDAKEPV